MFDTYLRNGRIIDGTGQTWFRGGVGITGDSVTIVRSGESGVEAGRVIDVGGSIICPGFIDMHSHSDLVLLSNPKHEIKLRQGVTTELMGMDGLSYAPSSPEKLEQLLYYLAAVNGMPPEGVRWGSVREYLDLFDNRVACNVAFMAPHAAIRVEAMGWEDRLPTEPELARHARARPRGHAGRRLRVRHWPHLPAGRLQRHQRVGGSKRGYRRPRRHVYDPRPLLPR